MGLAIYYGIAAWVSKLLTKIVNTWPLYVYGAAAISGIVLLGAGIRLIVKTKQSNAGKKGDGCEEAENVKAPAQLSPVSLFLMGTAAIRKLERVLDKVSSYIVPVVVSLVGILLGYYGVTSLM